MRTRSRLVGYSVYRGGRLIEGDRDWYRIRHRRRLGIEASWADFGSEASTYMEVDSAGRDLRKRTSHPLFSLGIVKANSRDVALTC